jgi:hypothetical protein
MGQSCETHPLEDKNHLRRRGGYLSPNRHRALADATTDMKKTMFLRDTQADKLGECLAPESEGAVEALHRTEQRLRDVIETIPTMAWSALRGSAGRGL